MQTKGVLFLTTPEQSPPGKDLDTPSSGMHDPSISPPTLWPQEVTSCHQTSHHLVLISSTGWQTHTHTPTLHIPVLITCTGTHIHLRTLTHISLHARCILLTPDFLFSLECCGLSEPPIFLVFTEDQSNPISPTWCLGIIPVGKTVPCCSCTLLRTQD